MEFTTTVPLELRPGFFFSNKFTSPTLNSFRKFCEDAESNHMQILLRMPQVISPINISKKPFTVSPGISPKFFQKCILDLPNSALRNYTEFLQEFFQNSCMNFSKKSSGLLPETPPQVNQNYFTKKTQKFPLGMFQDIITGIPRITFPENPPGILHGIFQESTNESLQEY